MSAPETTEVYTVTDPDGNEVWSSGPNSYTAGAAALAASDCGGKVQRAVYTLVEIYENEE